VSELGQDEMACVRQRLGHPLSVAGRRQMIEGAVELHESLRSNVATRPAFRIFAAVKGGRSQGSMASIGGEPGHEEKRNQDHS
jgi:hypothetical protein